MFSSTFSTILTPSLLLPTLFFLNTPASLSFTSPGVNTTARASHHGDSEGALLRWKQKTENTQAFASKWRRTFGREGETRYRDAEWGNTKVKNVSHHMRQKNYIRCSFLNPLTIPVPSRHVLFTFFKKRNNAGSEPRTVKQLQSFKGTKADWQEKTFLTHWIPASQLWAAQAGGFPQWWPAWGWCSVRTGPEPGSNQTQQSVRTLKWRLLDFRCIPLQQERTIHVFVLVADILSLQLNS